MQAYSDPSRESEPTSLPDIEVFYMNASEVKAANQANQDESYSGKGWYWWSCFPGCLPDSSPMGPFDTEQEALEDAQDFE